MCAFASRRLPWKKLVTARVLLMLRVVVIIWSMVKFSSFFIALALARLTSLTNFLRRLDSWLDSSAAAVVVALAGFRLKKLRILVFKELLLAEVVGSPVVTVIPLIFLRCFMKSLASLELSNLTP